MYVNLIGSQCCAVTQLLLHLTSISMITKTREFGQTVNSIFFFNQFTVVASDQRAIDKRTKVPVSVVVSRDQQPPSFNAPYITDMSENRGVEERVARGFTQDPDIQV